MPCCGQVSEEDIAEVAAIGRTERRTGGVMKELYAQVPGAAIQIGAYGHATNGTPALVPDDVAEELAKDPRFGPNPAPPAQPLVREWHAKASDVYHDNPACTTGNNVEPENRRPGAGGRKRCAECAGEKPASKAERSAKAKAKE